MGSVKSVLNISLRDLHGSRFDAGTSNKKWHPHVELERKTLAFDKSELPQVISVIGRINNICIIQFTQILQFLIDLRQY